MSPEGHIENGRVVLDEPVSLPNGTRLCVETVGERDTVPARGQYDEFSELAGLGVVDTEALKALRAASTL